MGEQMYSYEEIREAIMAFLRMGYGDFKGEEYIVSLSKAAGYMKGEDKSLALFTKLFEDNDVVHKLNSCGHTEEEF